MSNITLPNGDVIGSIVLTEEEVIKLSLGDEAERVVPAVAAQGSITFHYLPKAGDSLTVNGTKLVFGTDIDIEDSLQAQATTTADALNDSADANVAAATYSPELNPLNEQPTGVVRVIHGTPGKAGNKFTLRSASSGPVKVGDRVSRTGRKNVNLPAASIEVTPRLEGGHDATVAWKSMMEKVAADRFGNG